MLIYIIRHGETDLNTEGIIRSENGSGKVPGLHLHFSTRLCKINSQSTTSAAGGEYGGEERLAGGTPVARRK